MSAVTAPPISVGEMTEEFLAFGERLVAEGRMQPSTFRGWKQILPAMVEIEFRLDGERVRLADLAVRDVSRENITALLYRFAQTNNSKGKLPAPISVRNARSVLGAFFRHVWLDLGLPGERPTVRIEMKAILNRPVEVERPRRYLTLDEQERLLANLKRGSRPSLYHPLVATILGTGLRSAEARGLRWQDITWESDVEGVGGVVTCRGQATEDGGFKPVLKKRRRGVREISISEEALAVLHEQRERLRRKRMPVEGEAFVFPTTSGGTGTMSNLHRAVRAAAKAAGLGPGLGVHDLRHSYAKTMIQDGMPIDILSQFLGHKDVATTAATYLDAEDSIERKGEEAAKVWARQRERR